MDKLQYTKNEKGDEPRLWLALPIPRTTFKLQANFPDAVFTPSLKLKHFQLHISSKDCMFFVHPGFENTNSLIYLFLLQKEYVPITEHVESIKMYQEGGEKKKKSLIIKSPGGNHCYKLRWISNLCYYAVLTYMRNYCIYDFAEDTFLLH